MTRAQKLISVTILDTASASGAFDLFGYRIAGVHGSGAWTTADITFQVDPGDGTFVPVTDNSGAFAKISGVSEAAAEVLTPPEIGDCITGERGKLVSTNNSSEVAVAQGADRTLKVLLIPL